MLTSMSGAVRYDSHTFSKFRKDARGFLRVPAAPTKAGIFVYRRADGSEVRELRPLTEVFHADSLATLEYAPVTALHPSEPVGPGNIRELGIGRAISTPRQDGEHVSLTLAIEDGDAINRVTEGKDRELSCGYTCDVDPTPGTYQGERYDAVQRNIRYNHIGLGPAGWGRGGESVSLRMDSNDAVMIGDTPPKKESNKPMATIRLDGVDYEAPDTTASVVQREIEKRDSKLKELQTRADKAEAERDIAKKELETERDPKVRQDAVNARVALEKNASKVLGEEKLDGLSDQEIRCKVVTKADTGLDIKDKSEAYVEALFDATVAKASKRNDGLQRTAGTTTTETETREDSDPYANKRNAYDNFWKGSN